MSTTRKPGTIDIAGKDGTKITLTLKTFDGVDQDFEAAYASVQVLVNVGRDNQRIGTEPKKDHLLLGYTVGAAPSNDSVLGKLRERLNNQFRNRVRVELAKEYSDSHGLLAQKGYRVYDVKLYPIPDGCTSAQFHAAVRREFDTIKEELQPQAAGRGR